MSQAIANSTPPATQAGYMAPPPALETSYIVSTGYMEIDASDIPISSIEPLRWNERVYHDSGYEADTEKKDAKKTSRQNPDEPSEQDIYEDFYYIDMDQRHALFRSAYPQGWPHYPLKQEDSFAYKRTTISTNLTVARVRAFDTRQFWSGSLDTKHAGKWYQRHQETEEVRLLSEKENDPKGVWCCRRMPFCVQGHSERDDDWVG